MKIRKIICGEKKCKLQPKSNMNTSENELSGSIGASSTEYSVPINSIKTSDGSILKRKQKRVSGSFLKTVTSKGTKKTKKTNKKGKKSKKKASNKSKAKKISSGKRKQSKKKKK